jgi:DNA-binding CsgD family transcriptional regulator
MSKSMRSLIEQIALSQSEHEVRMRFMDAVGDVFHAEHWAIALHHSHREAIDLAGLPDRFIDYYKSFGVTIDPLRRYVEDHHAPVHEQVLFTEEQWKQSDLYIHGCGRQYDHEHAMIGAIVGQGRLIGTVHFSRGTGTAAFNPQDLANLSALCAHLSATLALLQTPQQGFRSSAKKFLTPRELQIAELVAKGLTNAEIGKELWITQNSVKQALKRMFQKLNISARTELVAKLHDIQDS